MGLFVAYYRRAMPRFATVKELLNGGRIGELRSVSIRSERPGQVDGPTDARWRVDPTLSGGGHFVDLGSHTLDLLDWLLGPVIGVSGVATNRGGRYRAEDLVAAVFSFASGVEGVGLWNYDSFQYTDQVEVTGTEGALRFSCFAGEPLRLVTASGVEHIEAPYPDIVQLPLIQTVVDALTGRGESPSDGHTALRTARVIDTLLSDYRQRHGITYPPAPHPMMRQADAQTERRRGAVPLDPIPRCPARDPALRRRPGSRCHCRPQPRRRRSGPPAARSLRLVKAQSRLVALGMVVRSDAWPVGRVLLGEATHAGGRLRAYPREARASSGPDIRAAADPALRPASWAGLPW